MSQKASDKSQTVKTPVVRVGDALVRDGETITGNPARTKYLGNHLTKPKSPVSPPEEKSVSQVASKTKSKGAED